MNTLSQPRRRGTRTVITRTKQLRDVGMSTQLSNSTQSSAQVLVKTKRYTSVCQGSRPELPQPTMKRVRMYATHGILRAGGHMPTTHRRRALARRTARATTECVSTTARLRRNMRRVHGEEHIAEPAIRPKYSQKRKGSAFVPTARR